MILVSLFKRILNSGSLELISADGKRARVGDDSPPITVRLHDKRVGLDLALNPYLVLGEAYMDGRLTVDEPHRIYDVLALLMSNVEFADAPASARLFERLRHAKRRLDQHNPLSRARENVAHHYDLDDGLYDLFLDSDKQYSCAYFERPDASLEEAQLAKKRHIVAKLAVEPGQKVLDIGCGWGGMALYLAKHTSAHVVGVTLSENQARIARERVKAEGLDDRVDIRLTDYRDLDESFDRIVSVGMFEHVGVGHFDEYFGKVHELLPRDGVALIHTIGRRYPPGATNAWIAKYIFPGGYIPALSETMAAVERQNLFSTDIEVLRLHYALTLREWRKRFMAQWETAKAIYDERFCRMWEFYLSASECSFRYDGMVNFQLQLAKNVNALPITRGYMPTEEEALRDKDTGTANPVSAIAD